VCESLSSGGNDRTGAFVCLSMTTCKESVVCQRGAGSLRLLVSLVRIAGTVHDDRCSLVKDSTAGSRAAG
jgi:hypothetical protein